MNLGRLLTNTARRRPQETALIWGDRRWSWAALNARVDALVAALAGLGLEQGERVLVQARNSNQMFETLWATFKLGAVWVPCNFRLSPPEVAHLAASSGARVMIADGEFADHVAAVRTKVPALTSFVAIGEGLSGADDYEAMIEPHIGTTLLEAEVNYDDPCWFFYTSGTTGLPKAAVLTHGQLAFVVNNHIADLMPGLGMQPGVRDVSLAMAPLSHGAGAHALSQVARGVPTVLSDNRRFDEAQLWRLIQEHRVTNFFSVPTMLTRLARSPEADRVDHASLRHVIYAGAPMYRADQVEALRVFGSVLVQYYGLGEVTGNITLLPPDDHVMDDGEMRIGSCGFARTGMEIAIKNSEGRRLDAGESGEICVRGPAVFAGYYNNPEANAKALKDGWFHTGDLGRLDEAGYLYITGRASDMYICNGANIYPRDAEEVLLTHPQVAEVAVLGVPDPAVGEMGVAVVVLSREGAASSEADLLGFLDGKLAKYKWPRRVIFWDELPKSGYGKVPKHIIRQGLYERGEVQSGDGA